MLACKWFSEQLQAKRLVKVQWRASRLAWLVECTGLAGAPESDDGAGGFVRFLPGRIEL